MKYLALLLPLVLAAKTFASGFSVIAGINSSELYDTVSKQGVGHSLGFGYALPLSNVTFLQMGLNIVTKSFRLENKTVYTSTSYPASKYNIDGMLVYVQVPVHFKWQFLAKIN